MTKKDNAHRVLKSWRDRGYKDAFYRTAKELGISNQELSTLLRTPVKKAEAPVVFELQLTLF
jgi:hypothetical protein